VRPDRRALVAAIVSLSATAAAGAQSVARPDAFRYERPILPAEAGSNRLALDPTILAGGAPFRVQEIDPRDARVTADYGGHVFMATGGLNDLRIYEANGRAADAA